MVAVEQSAEAGCGFGGDSESARGSNFGCAGSDARDCGGLEI
jgi:hypothetical protein